MLKIYHVAIHSERRLNGPLKLFTQSNSRTLQAPVDGFTTSISSPDIFDSDDERMGFREWFQTDWLRKEATLSTLREVAMEAEEPEGIVYRFNILTSHKLTHTSENQRRLGKKGFFRLNTGIDFRVEPGVVGEVRLRPHFQKQGHVLLNGPLDHNTSCLFELLLSPRYSTRRKVNLKADIFAEIIFNQPVKITESIEEKDDIHHHVVSVVQA